MHLFSHSYLHSCHRVSDLSRTLLNQGVSHVVSLFKNILVLARCSDSSLHLVCHRQSTFRPYSSREWTFHMWLHFHLGTTLLLYFILLWKPSAKSVKLLLTNQHTLTSGARLIYSTVHSTVVWLCWDAIFSQQQLGHWTFETDTAIVVRQMHHYTSLDVWTKLKVYSIGWVYCMGRVQGN